MGCQIEIIIMQEGNMIINSNVKYYIQYRQLNARYVTVQYSPVSGWDSL